MTEKKKKGSLLRLNFASGIIRKDGFLSVDIRKSVKPDILCDLTKKLPWKDNSVDEISCNNFLHLLNGEERVKFLDEIYRILKPNPKSDPEGSRAVITTHHWANTNAYLDPNAKFPPVCESTYAIFNRKWRQDNGYDYYDIKSNFKSPIGWANPHPDFIGRNDEYMIKHATHSINAVNDLMVTLFKLPIDLLEL